MNFDELAKFASAKRKESSSTPEQQISRLEKSVEREKRARRQAEETIEEASRRLYVANKEAERLNKQLEDTLLDLNETLSALTSAQAHRKATIITLFIAAFLFFTTEFALEPVLESRISNTLFLVIAKGLIFAILIPVEIISSRIVKGNLIKAGEINESLYNDLLIAAYDDGVITEMERNLLRSSAKQLGISDAVAMQLEEQIASKLSITS